MAATIEPSHFKIVQPMFDELSRIIQGSVAGNFQIIMQMVSARVKVVVASVDSCGQRFPFRI
ncbi:hypothetical protein AO411_2025505 [Salmonella enterica subsp. enterica serovar Sarajane]|nr:hypothetical protein AO411_2025505 [Salmonella enterica subsp. enterica serovar Sarajane]